jgi:hypothetical protein
MTTSSFRKGLERAWLAAGFHRAGKSYRRDGSTAATLLSAEKGFGSQWFISVGFWLMGLGADVPDRVERTHMYFRLERLFPEFRETILAAGALGEPEQPESFEQLLHLLAGPIDAALRALGTEEGLRAAINSDRLCQGLIRKEAREYLVE